VRLHLTENAIVEEFFDVHHNLKAKGYVDFAIGMLAVSKQPDAAQALVKLMSSPPLARNSVPTYVLIIVASLQLDFADLNGGLGVGVVGVIGKDRLRMRGKGGLKGVRRVEIEMPLRDIGRRHPGRAACDALFNRHALAGWAGRGAGP
jgi:hypothetical protein